MNGTITSWTKNAESPIVVKGAFLFILILVVVTVVVAVDGGHVGQVSEAVASFIGTLGGPAPA